MLLTRVLTAAALLAAFLAALLFLDAAAFALLAAAIVAVGGYEWACLSKSSRIIALSYGTACALLFYALAQYPWMAPWICGVAAIFWIAVAPTWLARGFDSGLALLRPAAGIAVLVPAGIAMAALQREHLLLILGLVWIADTVAYLVGSTIGSRKLVPSISPGKTWEGVAGGAVACVIYAIICAMFVPDLGGRVQGVIWVPYLAGTVLLCAASIVGDLFESALKRQAGAKDSGVLLPGHGGVLDRIDSATATLPLALLLLQAIGAT